MGLHGLILSPFRRGRMQILAIRQSFPLPVRTGSGPDEGVTKQGQQPEQRVGVCALREPVAALVCRVSGYCFSAVYWMTAQEWVPLIISERQQNLRKPLPAAEIQRFAG